MSGRVPAVIVAAGLGALVGYPLFELLRQTGDAVLAGSVWGAGTGAAVRNSFVTSVSATLLATVIGVLSALAIERRARSVRLRVAVVIPLLVPPFVSAVAFTRAFGPGGLTDDVFGVTLPGLIGPVGIVLVMAVHAAPLVHLVVSAAIAARARPELEWAARSCGASPGQAFRRVTLPLLAPAIAGGGALAFVISMNSFGIPAVLGIPAGYPTITTRIYGDLARSADPAAFSRVLMLATLLVAVVLVAVLVGDRLVRRAVAGRPAGSAREPMGVGTAGRRGRRVVVAYLVVTTALPLAALVLTGLTRAVGLDPWPTNWTLANFSEAWSGGAWGAAGRSLLLGAVAATLTTVLGLLLALRSGRHTVWAGGMTVAAFAVPGSALAVAVLLAYGPWLRDTMVIIVVAYLAKFWALADRAVAGSVAAIDRDAVRAGRVSGARSGATLRRIVVPMLRPAVVAAWLLVFLFGIHELTMSSLLYGPATATLAVHTLNVQQLGDATVTAALAVLLTLPGLVAAGLVAGRRPS